MRTRIILLLLVCFSCTAFAQSDGTFITSFGKINLIGNWKGDDDEDGHRSIPYIPVIASLENAIITLEFMEADGDVTVTIIRESQTSLSHSLLVDSPGKYCIPIDAYVPGVYLLELSNSQGGYVYGWFEVK